MTKIATDAGDTREPSGRLFEEDVLRLCPFAVFGFRPDGVILRANDAATALRAKIVGPGAGDVIGSSFFDLTMPLDNGLRSLLDQSTGLGLVCRDHRVTVIPVDPETTELALAVSVIRLANNEFAAMARDVSEVAALEDKLRYSEAWTANPPDPGAGFAVLRLDAEGTIIDCSPATERVIGYASAELIGQRFTMLYAEADYLGDRLMDRLGYAEQSGWHMDEAWYIGKSGLRRRCASVITVSPPTAGEPIRDFTMVVQDVAEREVSGEALRRLATTDHLTGLYNRSYFMSRVTTEISRWLRYGRGLSLILIDADHFKRVNDEFGHLAGDEVLKDLARRTQAGLRTIDIAARFGGEEFVALLPSTPLAGALVVAERIRLDVMNHVVDVDGVSIAYTISIGVAEFTARSDTIEAVIKRADDALYRAKRTGRNRVCVEELAQPPGTAKPDPTAKPV